MIFSTDFVSPRARSRWMRSFAISASCLQLWLSLGFGRPYTACYKHDLRTLKCLLLLLHDLDELLAWAWTTRLHSTVMLNSCEAPPHGMPVVRQRLLLVGNMLAHGLASLPPQHHGHAVLPMQEHGTEGREPDVAEGLARDPLLQTCVDGRGGNSCRLRASTRPPSWSGVD